MQTICTKVFLTKTEIIIIIIIEIQRMWNVKAEVIPIIIEPSGTMSKSFKKYLSNILGKYEIKEM